VGEAERQPSGHTGPGETGDAADRARQRAEQQRRLRKRLSAIRHTLAVLSGKGGVGKSAVAANLGAALAMKGYRVGLLDSDFHGPSIPRMLRLEGAKVISDGQSIQPATCEGGMKVMSIAFLLQQADDAVIWRGPLKMGVLRQFLADVDWGELDFLIIDLPPGTGDEPLSVCQTIPHISGAIVVTTPQEVALSDVRKCITFCRRLHLSVTGVIENMSGFVCPRCGHRTDVFGSGGGERMARQMGVPFLGRIPLDPALMQACEEGEPFVRRLADSQAGRAFLHIVDAIVEAVGAGSNSSTGGVGK